MIYLFKGQLQKVISSKVLLLILVFQFNLGPKITIITCIALVFGDLTLRRHWRLIIFNYTRINKNLYYKWGVFNFMS